MAALTEVGMVVVVVVVVVVLVVVRVAHRDTPSSATVVVVWPCSPRRHLPLAVNQALGW